MEGRNNKVAEMFVKDLLALYNTYMLLGVSKLDMCGILINTLAGLYITMAIELEKEIEDDGTIHWSINNPCN